MRDSQKHHWTNALVRAGLAALLVAAAAGTGGCTRRGGRRESANPDLRNRPDDGAASGAPAQTAPGIDGQWTGVFSDPINGTNQSLRATIRQEGDRVAIETTLTGVGSFFTGTIDAAGHLMLTDAWDGENWTTHEGPATRSRIVIQDLVPDPANSALVLYNTIELRR